MVSATNRNPEEQYGSALVVLGELTDLFTKNPLWKEGDIIEKIEFYLPPKYRYMEIMFVAKHTSGDTFGQTYAVDAILYKERQEIVWQAKVL